MPNLGAVGTNAGPFSCPDVASFGAGLSGFGLRDLSSGGFFAGRLGLLAFRAYDSGLGLGLVIQEGPAIRISLESLGIGLAFGFGGRGVFGDSRVGSS